MNAGTLPWPRSLARRLRRRPGVLLCDTALDVGDLVVVADAPRCRLRRVGGLAELGVAASGAELETLWVLPRPLLAAIAPLLPPGTTALPAGRAGTNEAGLVLPLRGGDLGVLEQALQRYLDEGSAWSPAWLLVTAVVPPDAAAGATLCFAHRLRRAPVPRPLRGRPRWRLLPFGHGAPALPFVPRRGAAAQAAPPGSSVRSRS